MALTKKTSRHNEEKSQKHRHKIERHHIKNSIKKSHMNISKDRVVLGEFTDCEVPKTFLKLN